MYQIIDLSDELDLPEYPEQLGTKEKFWTQYDGTFRLLKFGRPGTGEDWAEKVASELCTLLSISHAEYDLARYKGRTAVLSPTMIPDGGRLILGNELINRVIREYDGTLAYHQKQHTVSRVLASLATFTPDRVETWGKFIGYLMLDAWIGNSDRHHENWGLIVDSAQQVSLAPTFDHASCLGRELVDEVRLARLATKDKRYSVEVFAEKARSALYVDPADQRPLSTFDAFMFAARVDRQGAFRCVERLASVHMDSVQQILAFVPEDFMSDAAKRFAFNVLTFNRERLCSAVLK